MKTRSNMHLFVVECTDITKLTDDQINALHCGDYLVKKTGKQRHAYKVTYKEDKQGICLSYFACGYTETVSYDYTAGHWVYNSTDVSSIYDNFEVENLDVKGDISLNGEDSYEIIDGTSSITTNLRVSNSFIKVVRNFHELQFIFSARIANDGDSNVTINDDSILVNYGTLDNKYKEKIYGHNGYNLLETPSNVPIACVPLMINHTGGNIVTGSMPRYASLYYVKSTDAMTMYLVGGSITIGAGTTYDFEARISLAI